MDFDIGEFKRQILIFTSINFFTSILSMNFQDLQLSLKQNI